MICVRRARECRRAVATVEFALLLPFILMLLLGIWEVGRIADVSGIAASPLSPDDLALAKANLQRFLQSDTWNRLMARGSTRTARGRSSSRAARAPRRHRRIPSHPAPTRT